MDLSKPLFDIDCSAVVPRIETFIREKMTALNRDGILIALSGGLDSSTTAGLCVRAVGKERVFGIMLPERQGNPEADHYGEKVARYFGIASVTYDISRLLRKLGTYRFITSLIPGNALRTKIVKNYLEKSGRSPFLDSVSATGSHFVRKGYAVMNTKHRVRLVVTYKFAEERNLMVVGNAHKSEDMVGLFTKHGVDDHADLMPLKNLYRSHILQIADYVGVPEEILSRSPNPDIIPGVTDKYKDILGIDSGKLDLILLGLEKGMDPQSIARQLGLNQTKVEEMAELISITGHMRNKSMAPEGLLNI